MTYPDGEHAERFEDAALVLKLAKITPGLPFPHISGQRAVFHFNGITHALEAAEAVADAETILSYALDLTFARADAMAGDDTMRYILRGYMTSGFAVDIVAKAEHMSVRREPAAVAA